MELLQDEAGIRPPESWAEPLREELWRNRRNGAVGQLLLSDTDRVRVWRISLAPGERVGFHRHQMDYFWLALTEGQSRSHYANGALRDTRYAAGDTRHFRFAAGEFLLHDLENTGDTALEFVTVELKGGPNPPLPL